MLDKAYDALEGLQGNYLDYLNKMNECLPKEIRSAALITPHGLNRFTSYKIESTGKISRRTTVCEYQENETREVDNLDGNWVQNLWRRITGNAKIKKAFKVLKVHI